MPTLQRPKGTRWFQNPFIIIALAQTTIDSIVLTLPSITSKRKCNPPKRYCDYDLDLRHALNRRKSNDSVKNTTEYNIPIVKHFGNNYPRGNQYRNICIVQSEAVKLKKSQMLKKVETLLYDFDFTGLELSTWTVVTVHQKEF